MQNKSKLGLAGALLAVFLASPEADAATVTVLFASKGSYQTPKVVDENESLRIKDGERLVVILPSGSIKRLLGEAGKRKIKAREIMSNESVIVLAYKNLVYFIINGGISTKDMAGTKGPKGFDTIPLTESGTFCLPAGASPHLERYNLHIKSATVAQQSSGSSKEVLWDQRNLQADWPTEFLPIQANQTYTITHEFLGRKSTSVQFVEIEKQLVNQTSSAFYEETLRALAEKSCVYQLRMWLARQSAVERQRH